MSRLLTAVVIVAQKKYLFCCEYQLGVCFHASLFISKLPRCANVHVSSSLDRPLFEVYHCWLAWDSSLGLQVTQRDVISNQCHAFICSAGASRGWGLWADLLGLWSMQQQTRAARRWSRLEVTHEFTGEQTPAFVMGCPQKSSNQSWSNERFVNGSMYYKR